MHFVDCNLCGLDETKTVGSLYSSLYGRLMRFNIVKCRNCDLIYVNPQPDDSEVKVVYEVLYDKLTPSDETRRQRRIERRQEELEKLQLIERHTTKGRILDVGTGLAVFLEVAREWGWRVWGLEINKSYASYAQNQLKLNVQQLTLREAHFPSGFFDVVNMDNVLEHLTNPRKELEEVWRVLKKGGHILIRVPNTDNFVSKFADLYRLTKGRRTESHDLPLFHLYFFNLKTLVMMLKQCRFKVGLATTSLWSYVSTNNYGIKGITTKILNAITNWMNRGYICTVLATKRE